MSSMLSSQGIALATAMAVSGTVILLAFGLQKSFISTQFSLHQIPQSSPKILRSCISSDGRKKQKKKMKRVHFAEDVMDPRGDGEDFRRKRSMRSNSLNLNSQGKPKNDKNEQLKGLPANRAALYNGILRDRGVLRLAFSY